MGLFTWLSKRNLDFPATKSTSPITIKIVLPPHHFFIVSGLPFAQRKAFFLWTILIIIQFILFPLLLLSIKYNEQQ